MAKTVSGKELSSLGIGTYGVGGRGHRNMQISEKDADAVYVDALVYALEKGSNFTEVSLGYGHGKSIELFKRALETSSISREDIFLTHSLYPADLPSKDALQKDVDSFYEIMESNYADSTLVTQSLILGFGEDVIYGLLRSLLEKGKTRYVSLSNASPIWIRKFKQEFGDKFFAHEGHLSFEVRILQDKGVFGVCKDLGVENIVWRPLLRNKTLNDGWPLLTELAEKYNKTQSQVILNWMRNLNFRPMVFSTNRQHINENFSSGDFQMQAEDYERMNAARPFAYNVNSIDWEGSGIDSDIVALTK